MGSHKFAQGRGGFAKNRDRYAKVPRRVRTHLLSIREHSRRIYDRFASGSHMFARVCGGYNTIP
eukprot:1719768-Prymnesium_polylepis.1